MTAEPLWISEADVAATIDMADAIAALRAMLRAQAAGRADNMVKTHAVWGGHNTLHAIGAVAPDAGVVATKTWAHTAGGATPLLMLFDAADGGLLAVIEAFALGQLRTGGIAGVATDLLAAADADTLAMIGTGRQASAQIAAVAAVRRLRRVNVWSPDPDRRGAFVAQWASELGLPLVAADSLAAALDGAQVVTLATRATAPVVAADALPAGVHVNALGAITPERAEFEPALLDRCASLLADSPAQVRALSREFATRFGADESSWARLRPLAEAVAADQARPEGADLTLFKGMGMGLSDLALGLDVLRHARAGGLGRTLPQPRRARPRLVRTQPLAAANLARSA